MKALLFCVISATFCINTNAQDTRKTGAQKRTATTSNRNAAPVNSTMVNSKAASQSTKSEARQTITEQRLNTSSQGISFEKKNSEKETPFVSGIHAATDENPTMQSGSANNSNVTNPTGGNANTLNANNIGSNIHNGTNVAGGNDTTFNVNTTNQNGVNTNAGAVDRSGQSQFGQTNWGRNNRNTVGESQWTVPPPITASFNKQFPDVSGAQWTRNNGDTSIYAVRYKAGANWASSRYNAAGDRLDTRIDIPLVQAPRPVSVYLAKQADDFRITSISRLQIQGKPELYEIRTASGNTIYVNNDGMETRL
jgi:hypothetical protein